MYYEINVSLNGQHYFATAQHSLNEITKARKLVEHFRLVFPASDGYECSLTRYETSGTPLES